MVPQPTLPKICLWHGLQLQVVRQFRVNILVGEEKFRNRVLARQSHWCEEQAHRPLGTWYTEAVWPCRETSKVAKNMTASFLPVQPGSAQQIIRDHVRHESSI